jgi:phosphoribosyl 1,2-cyclic phosphate phosphodiesterase
MVETGVTTLLVDTSPDLRQQLLNHGTSKIDAVLFTHAHYDHINGINELRPIFMGQEEPLHIYASLRDLTQIRRAFFYLFEKNNHEIYHPYIKTHVIENNFVIGDISGCVFSQDHGFSYSLGIRIGDFGYSTDVVSLSDDNISLLKGILVWIVGCQSMLIPKPTHAPLPVILKWVQEITPRQTFLTHMGPSMDYNTLLNMLPAQILPAYDGMTIEI